MLGAAAREGRPFFMVLRLIGGLKQRMPQQEASRGFTSTVWDAALGTRPLRGP